MSDNLPRGWLRASLDEVRASDAPIIYGILQPGPNVPDGIPYVRPTEIIDNEIRESELRRTSKQIADRYRRATLARDDVIFTIVGSIGKVALVPSTLVGANLTQSSSRVRASRDIIDPRYLRFVMLSPIVMGQCEEYELGTAVPRLNLEDVRRLRIPIAPLNEQRRIVAMLEKILVKVNACQTRLKRIPLLLKRFRQAVLAAACSGRLTKDWRERASTEELTVREPANAKVLREVESLFEVPSHWRWMPLQATCHPSRAISYGVIKLGVDCEQGVPCLRTSDVKALRIDVSSVKKIAPEIARQYERTFLRGGEVLVNVRGTLGGVAVVPNSLKGWNISRELAMLSVDLVVPEFVALWIASSPCQNWLTGVAKGVAYTGINIEDLRLLPIALPSGYEQKEIVRRVEELFAFADQVEARYAKAKAFIDKLTQSVLAKAFRGELVPQDPNDESASVLLERIRSKVAQKDDRQARRAA